MYYVSIKAGWGILVIIFYCFLLLLLISTGGGAAIGPNCYYRARPPPLAPENIYIYIYIYI